MSRLDLYDNALPEESRVAPSGRPFIGILFDCCGVYGRIYRDPDADRYDGRCPRCLRRLTVRVGHDGVQQRIFRAQ
ncbi:hypothetical protein RAS1_22660 [Phycisphaerae bacterium RAS1]|nr:hypothetical protein RAS1_22660 [Phycisphaerae bacterium RAS1]